MNVYKKITSVLTLAFSCQINNLSAMASQVEVANKNSQPSILDKQLWDAVVENKQDEIIKLLKIGANVNAPSPDEDGSSILSRYVFSEMSDPNGVRINIILSLLAAGARGQQALIDQRIGYRQTRNYSNAYKDQGIVFVMLENIQVTPDEVKDIMAGNLTLRHIAQNSSNMALPKEIRKLITSKVIQKLVTEKFELARRTGFTLDENKNTQLMSDLRKAIELNVFRALSTQQ